MDKTKNAESGGTPRTPMAKAPDALPRIVSQVKAGGGGYQILTHRGEDVVEVVAAGTMAKIEQADKRVAHLTRIWAADARLLEDYRELVLSVDPQALAKFAPGVDLDEAVTAWAEEQEAAS